MLIITTIYAMDLEPAKTVFAQKPAKENDGNVPEDGREFLGIYQGRNHAEPDEK
jgi:hypothetical protein